MPEDAAIPLLDLSACGVGRSSASHRIMLCFLRLLWRIRGMEEREYRLMAAVEDRHFWFLGMRAIFRDAYLAAGLGPDSQVLDLGCATGGMMRFLRGLGRFTGLDRSEVAAQIAEERSGCPVVTGDATALPFPDESFDGAMALDVLEHIEDDRGALREVHRVLRPRGVLLAAVPCHPALFSSHDRALMHLRRYRRREFVALVRETGFAVERVTWTNALLFPLAAISRLVRRVMDDRRGEGSDLGLFIGPTNGVLLAVMRLERALLRRMAMPWGLSLLVVARRDGGLDEREISADRRAMAERRGEP